MLGFKCKTGILLKCGGKAFYCMIVIVSGVVVNLCLQEC